MASRCATGLLVLLAGCVSQRTAPWEDATYAKAVALAQSCTGDPGLDRAMLAVAYHGDFRNGCTGFEADFGWAVVPSASCVSGCAGDDARTCRGPYQMVTHCALFDAKCTIVNGNASCVDTSGVLPCPGGATPICVENSLVESCPGDPATTYDCSLTLAGSSCAVGQCVLGAECVPGKILDGLACDGKSLRVCVAGRIDLVDCTALGFTGCDPFTRGCSPNPLLAP